MIVKSYEQLCNLPAGTNIYIVENPKAEIHAGLFVFNLTANLNTFYPFNVLKRTEADDIMFVKNDYDKKCGYDYNILEVYQELRDYDKLTVHRYIVATTERELIKEFKDSILQFEASAQRIVDMSKRFKSDSFGCELIKTHKDEFPEDWI